MPRPDCCKAFPALATLPLFLPRAASATHVKITDVRLSKIRLVSVTLRRDLIERT